MDLAEIRREKKPPQMPSNNQLTSIHDLLAYPSVLQMPAYQRQYSWEVQQLEDLWNDLFYLDSGKRYFFGTILLKRTTEANPGSGEVFEIIDGQQRLATVMILIQSILNELADLGQLEYSERMEIEKTFFKTGNEYKLCLQGGDDEVFHQVLNSADTIMCATASQKRLLICKNFFAERLRQHRRLLEQQDDEYGKFLREFMKKLLQWEIVKHVVETDEEAVLIFETVNDRGVALSLLDKTKSFLMRYLYLSSGAQDAQQSLNFLNDVFATIFLDVEQAEKRARGQVRSQKEYEKEIQRVHYVLFKAGASFFTDTFASLKDHLFSMYRKDARDPEACAQSAIEYASSLGRAFSSMKSMLLYSNEDKEIAFWLDRIFCQAYGTYLPLILSAWMTLECNSQELLTLLRAIECLEFRYSSFRARRSYTLSERINARALDLYRRNQDLAGVLSSLAYLIKHYASDGAFRADLESENFYFGSRPAMKLLFYEYEVYLRKILGKSMDISLGQWMSSDYQVDHVWAQAALNAGPDYQEYLECGNKMGNLVVLPAQSNAMMSNMNFTHKKTLNRESKLESLRRISDATSWRQREINKRTTELTTFAMERWILPRLELVRAATR